MLIFGGRTKPLKITNYDSFFFQMFYGLWFMERQRNYMDNELEELEAWVARELVKVTYYLEKEGIDSPNIGEWPGT